MLAVVAPAASLGAQMPPGKVMLALMPLLALLAGLIVYCLVDLIRAPSARYLPKPVWALIIVLVSAPLGALAYLIFGRVRRDHHLIEPDLRRGDQGRDADRADERLIAGR